MAFISFANFSRARIVFILFVTIFKGIYSAPSFRFAFSSAFSAFFENDKVISIIDNNGRVCYNQCEIKL